jgi:hypothetical protein
MIREMGRGGRVSLLAFLLLLALQSTPASADTKATHSLSLSCCHILTLIFRRFLLVLLIGDHHAIIRFVHAVFLGDIDGSALLVFSAPRSHRQHVR